MTRDKPIVIRVNQDEYEKINRYAKSKDLSVVQIIRDYIKGLPKNPERADATRFICWSATPLPLTFV
ncbi:MAG: DNA-binding protein [Okeania sp. SIO2D1]|nr:DNA-binding protein [Okeania sp. SIO2D1]